MKICNVTGLECAECNPVCEHRGESKMTVRSAGRNHTKKLNEEVEIMEKYRYENTIPQEALRQLGTDAKKRIEMHGKRELAKLLLNSLESVECGKNYLIRLEKEERASYRTDETIIRMTAYFKESEIQE